MVSIHKRKCHAHVLKATFLYKHRYLKQDRESYKASIALKNAMVRSGFRALPLYHMGRASPRQKVKNSTNNISCLAVLKILAISSQKLLSSSVLFVGMKHLLHVVLFTRIRHYYNEKSKHYRCCGSFRSSRCLLFCRCLLSQLASFPVQT